MWWSELIGSLNSQVRKCLGFCIADFLSLLAYESADQNPKYCLTWDFLSASCSANRAFWQIYLAGFHYIIPLHHRCQIENFLYKAVLTLHNTPSSSSFCVTHDGRNGTTVWIRWILHWKWNNGLNNGLHRPGQCGPFRPLFHIHPIHTVVYPGISHRRRPKQLSSLNNLPSHSDQSSLL